MCFEMKCLRSMTGVSRLDRVRNEVMRTRTGGRRELAARVDMEFCFSQNTFFLILTKE